MMLTCKLQIYRIKRITLIRPIEKVGLNETDLHTFVKGIKA